ncbi:response regulator transcription factor [Glaciihabitans sp. INWT7]|nr:response regulator transcription factor [Glaciihabitans sp. INWT7]QNE48004.1 response regulator transcription factor [Glaciihabitans sp. INWT7]
MSSSESAGRGRGTRVIIADDDVLLRAGLASLLTSAGFEVVEQFGDAESLLEAAIEHGPELLIIDIRMPPTHTLEGLRVAQAIRRALPSVGIMVLSSYVEVDHAITLLTGGSGIGYLLKQRVSDVDEFVLALERVAAGESVIDPQLVQELLIARRTVDPLLELTSRERDVLSLMAQGRSNLGIGQALHVSEGTVEKHVHHVLQKLGFADGEQTDHRRVLAVIAFLERA